MVRVVKKPPGFKKKHALKFGLKISARAPNSSKVTSVMCLFSSSFGREVKPGCLRKPTARLKVFQKFQTKLYTSHIEGQHPTKWGEYQRLQTEEQRTAFFDTSTNKPQDTLHAHFETSAPLFFDLNKSIVEVIIGDLLFHPDDIDGISHERALALFEAVEKDGEAVEDGSEAVRYIARVKNHRQFSLLVKFIACGASFRPAALQIECVKVETGIGDYGGCSDAVAANYARVGCAQSLQLLAEYMSQVWAFSLAFNGSTHQGMSYLDVRLRFGRGGRLHNFHLLAIPLFERHTGAYMFEVLVTFLDAMSSRWKNTVIAVSSDGAANMTGKVSGLVTHLQAVCAPGMLRIWCGLHQFDLVMQRVYSSAMDDKFYSTLTGLIGHLRRQPILIGMMQSTCSKVASTRWLSMGMVTKWLTKHHIRIRQHLATKAPACAPTESWWCVLFIIYAIATEATDVFIALQGRDTLLEQQYEMLQDLVHSYCSISGMVGPLGQPELEAFVELEPTKVCGTYALTVENASICMAGTSYWVCETMAELGKSNPREIERIARSTARVFVQAADGISRIVAERDESNEPLLSNPKVLPYQLVKIEMISLSAVLKLHRPRLLRHYKLQEHVKAIGDEFLQLQRAYRKEKSLREMVNGAEKSGLSFQESWKSIHERFPALADFCAGIASAFPNTATVESDFSMIGVEKNEYRPSLTDFSLEGILHCKQYETLTALSFQF